ncbi:hypothetical protein WA588_004332, partial [Blastocystis sp. NMH]
MDSFFKVSSTGSKQVKVGGPVFTQDISKHIVKEPPFSQDIPSKKEVVPSSLSWSKEFHSGVVGYWGDFIEAESKKTYFKKLLSFLATEEKSGKKIFPPRQEVFNAFIHCKWENVKVVILGQDPYHDDRQAHGLCFSVNKGIAIPPSLRNIYKEIENDLGIKPPTHGNLLHWADQGVLLLNTVLTVRAHEANSHKKQGWETFTDAVIKEINDKKSHVVFILWGNPAQTKGRIVNRSKHLVLESVHPSPLSANKGATFFNHHHFSQANAYLKEHGMEPIDW